MTVTIQAGTDLLHHLKVSTRRSSLCPYTGLRPEHRLARLEQLGLRQARYFGRVKTKFQLYLAATVANLTLLASQIGVVDDPGEDPDHIVTTAPIGANLDADHHFLPTWTLAWLRSPTLALSLFPSRAFRPAF